MKLLIVIMCFVGATYAAWSKECMAGHGSSKNPLECCKTPSLFSADATMLCKSQYPNHSKGPHKKCCVVECIMNSTGIIVNGNIDQVIAKKVMTQSVINDPAWVKVINAAIDKCMIDVEAKGAKLKSPPTKPTVDGEKVCNRLSGFFIGCVAGQLFKNCPAEKFTPGPECEKIKAFVDKCGSLMWKPKAAKLP